MVNENYLDILKGKYLLKELWKDKFYEKISENDYNSKRTEIYYGLQFELYEYIRYIYRDYLNKEM